MSGPTTVLMTPEIAVLLLAASAIRTAQALHAAYGEAERLRQAHDQGDADNRARQAEAAASGVAALATRRSEAETRFQRLKQLAAEAGQGAELKLPEAPAGSEPAVLAAYVRAVEGLSAALEALLAEILPAEAESRARLDELAGAEQIDLKRRLDAYAGRQVPDLLKDVRRLLARIAPLGPLPDNVAALVKQLEAPLTADRAEALLLELRRQVHLRQQQEIAAAQAVVLQQSLADLGYQVEDVAETLFVEGGVVHFRKPGWGNYMVRMRVDGKQQAANFNVIRAVAAGENERSVLDHLAEDRWCAEFPALLQALAVRGMKLTVTRRLEAGELPVQLVQRDKLPRFAEEEESVRTAALLRKAIT